jgi:hypothetical protein
MADDNRKKLGKVIARAWMDKDFRARLMKDPHAVLTEAGIHVHGKVHVHENTGSDVHLVIPKRPANLDEHVRKQKEKPGTCSADFCSTITPEFCSTEGPDACDADRVAPQFCSTI